MSRSCGMAPALQSFCGIAGDLEQAASISVCTCMYQLDISCDSFEGEGFAKIVFHIRRITVVACCRWIHLLEGKVGGWAYNSAFFRPGHPKMAMLPRVPLWQTRALSSGRLRRPAQPSPCIISGWWSIDFWSPTQPLSKNIFSLARVDFSIFIGRGGGG